MTDDDLDRLERLAAAATARGPHLIVLTDGRGLSTEQTDLTAAVPRLVAEVRRLRQERVERVRAERERIAAALLTGRWCRVADHMQGACDCEDMAAWVREGGAT